MNNCEILFYQNPDGHINIDVRQEEETFWLTLNQMAKFFRKSLFDNLYTITTMKICFVHMSMIIASALWSGKKKNLFAFLLLFLFFEVAFGSVSICSWNLQNFGNKKSDIEVQFIASTIQNYDVIAIQEVITGNGGALVVARLVTLMNSKGESWDYTISDPTASTSSNTSERYAFIWNKKTVTKLGDAWLENHYAREIDREPYFATFRKEGKEFTVVSFHAKPKAKQPETEIKYFKFFPNLYPKLNLIFCGDFNCPQSHTVFNPLKTMGYVPAFVGQKTTLRMKCVKNDCLASEYDNFFYNPKKIIFLKSGVIHFYKSFSSVEKARRISDHIPIYLTFN